MGKYRITTDDGSTYEVTTDEAPGVPNPLQANPSKYTPEGMKEPEYNFFTSPTGFIRSGLRRAVGGMEHMAQPGINPKLGGASEVIRGLGTAAVPAAIPFAVANPVPALVGTVAGTAAQQGVENLGPLVGMSPEGAALAGDVAGAASGYKASQIKGVPKLPFSPARIAAKVVGKKMGVPGAVVDAFLDHLTPPEAQAVSLQGQSGPGPYFHERTTVDPQFRGATPPAGPPYSTGTVNVPVQVAPPVRGLTRNATSGQVPPTVGPNTTGTVNVPSLPAPQPNLGTQAPMARGPVPSTFNPAPSRVFVGSSGTIPGEVGSPSGSSLADQFAAPSTKNLDDIAISLSGKKYAKLDAGGKATVDKIAAKDSGVSQPQGLTAPNPAAPLKFGGEEQDEMDKGAAMRAWAKKKADTSASQPLGGVNPADNETNLVNMLRGNTTRKNLEIGQYFTGKGMTPEQVAALPEAEFNAHIRNVKNASGNPYQPSTGRNYHRTPEQARADVVNAMRTMQSLPAPTMPTMIAATPAPRGFFPPPTWPPQPPAQ